MDAVIRKWGNSPALRLSLLLMETAGLALDQKVTVKAQRGRIVIEPVRPAVYSLDDLVSRTRAGILHGEADFGRPAGREWL